MDWNGLVLWEQQNRKGISASNKQRNKQQDGVLEESIANEIRKKQCSGANDEQFRSFMRLYIIL